MFLALPIVSPLFFAILMMFFYKNVIVNRFLNLVSGVVSFLVAITIFWIVKNEGIQILNTGNWEAPFGITLVSDMFSAIMVVVTAIIGLTTSVFALGTLDKERESFGFYPLLQILLMGINGAFLTGDIFNLYVWFEVMLISSFILLSLGGKKEQLEGAIKYVTLNLLSSALFLTGIGILYGIAGTLNMADLSAKLSVTTHSMITPVSVLFLIAFGIKSAVFPLFFWLPSSYHTPPSSVSAIFAGLLTKVGVYSLIRVFTLVFTENNELISNLFLVIAGFTMLTGVLGAAAQMDFRKILSFHIISQIGYMIMGLGLNSKFALTGTILYIMHHIIVKTNLFFVSGLIEKMRGSYDLKKLGGIYKLFPFIGLLFLIPALSLAGIPPLSGFWAKFVIIKASLDSSQYLIAGVSLFVSLLTIFSMMKIWNEVFWKDNPAPENKPFSYNSKKGYNAVYLPIILLAAITIIIGFNVGYFYDIAEIASEQLLNPAHYIKAVLGVN